MLIANCSLVTASLNAQQTKTFTHADTLRGSITPERAWWDVLRYDITVKPDYENKTIEGTVKIIYKINGKSLNKLDMDKPMALMQIDLQSPLVIDKVQSTENNNFSIIHKQGENVWYINKGLTNYIQKKQLIDSIIITYHGKPREAVRPPWDGGWIWKKDKQGRPWMSVACQGLGASVWYPCKDHQSDEPDNGASLTIIAPDTLAAVGNGRLSSTIKNNDGTATWKWEVKNPINNYNIIPYIGKYVNWTDTLHGEKGVLDMSFWVLDYNLDSAKVQFQQAKSVIHALEYWWGPYPFYEDSYKLVESPHLGMEHQSAVGYGNRFRNGYLGSDLSGSGWGLKWDFIIEHESSHEWFGNNITSKDLADMWIHESFANYSETLYTEYLFGREAGNDYNYGTRKKIRNDEPIIAHYNVNEEGSGDMYYKGGNMLQTIRYSINNDAKWRSILRGLGKTFYHQTVTAQQIENYISKNAGIDFSKVFDQYLSNIQIPQLSYYYSPDKKKVYYRWDSCINGFNLQLVLLHDGKAIRIKPTQQWKSLNDTAFFNTAWIDKHYYIKLKEVKAE
ncbi:Peptidase family M1 [Parafilimonas terrae]|uniref:Peptidase family M1 n=1 Tax=Parafilimonas terrae TaxID=1465490 RepID=A0A1I5S445_9BACT|nr:Peptidase family M1 [Parafilimonas terrae]